MRENAREWQNGIGGRRGNLQRPKCKTPLEQSSPSGASHRMVPKSIQAGSAVSNPWEPVLAAGAIRYPSLQLHYGRWRKFG